MAGIVLSVVLGVVLGSIHGVVELIGGHRGRLERIAFTAVRQHHCANSTKILWRSSSAPFPASECGRRSTKGDVSAHTFCPDFHCEGRSQKDDFVGYVCRSCISKALDELGVGIALLHECRWVGIEFEATPNHVCTFGRVGCGDNVDDETEAVEKLWAEFSFLGIHRANQNKTCRVLMGDRITLHSVDSRGSNIEENVNKVVGKEVDFIDVQHASVGSMDQTWPKRVGGSFEGSSEIDTANHSVLT